MCVCVCVCVCVGVGGWIMRVARRVDPDLPSMSLCLLPTHPHTQHKHKHTPQVLQAVEKAGGRVTVQDVAALAGVDLATAQKVCLLYTHTHTHARARAHTHNHTHTQSHTHTITYTHLVLPPSAP